MNPADEPDDTESETNTETVTPRVPDESVTDKSTDDAIEKSMEEIENVRIEDPVLVEYGARGNDDDRLSFTREWFPDSDEWKGKTNISPTQARALTVMRQLPTMLDDVLPDDDGELDRLLNALADDIEIYQTSIGGLSRRQQKEILELAFGGQEEKRTSRESSILDRYMQQMDNDGDS